MLGFTTNATKCAQSESTVTRTRLTSGLSQIQMVWHA